MKKWEYKAYSDRRPDERYLNNMGEQGWELVSIMPVNQSPMCSLYNLVWKREKKENKKKHILTPV